MKKRGRKKKWGKEGEKEEEEEEDGGDGKKGEEEEQEGQEGEEEVKKRREKDHMGRKGLSPWKPVTPRSAATSSARCPRNSCLTPCVSNPPAAFWIRWVGSRDQHRESCPPHSRPIANSGSVHCHSLFYLYLPEHQAGPGARSLAL